MSLTYGGIPLLYDHGGQVAKFLERNQCLDDLRDQTMPAAVVGGRDRLRGLNTSRVSVENPSYPTPPPIRINQLYWPTGATRWTVGYFLATGTNKDKIVKKAWKSDGNITLTLKSDSGPQNLVASLYLLTPRQVSCVPKSETLWILPLVDARYFWQFKHFGDNEVTSSTTWTSLFSTLGTQLGVTVSADSVASGYLKPDSDELTRRYDNAAIMLDAVAHSVGQRIVGLPNGTIKSQSWSEATSQLTENLTGSSYKPWYQIAGGQIVRHPTPENVVVAFPKVKYGKYCGEGVYAYTVSPTDSELVTTSGASKLIHSTARADFTTGGMSPDNDTELDALADKIAADYYASLAKVYDYTFAGTKKWEPTAFDDHILYQFGCEYEERPKPITSVDEDGAATVLEDRFENLAHTRIQSSPVNFASEFQLSQDYNVLNIKGDVIKCKPDLDLTAGLSGTCSIYEDNADTGDDVDVYLAWGEGGENVTAGKEIFAAWSPEECKWNWLGGECE